MDLSESPPPKKKIKTRINPQKTRINPQFERFSNEIKKAIASGVRITKADNIYQLTEEEIMASQHSQALWASNGSPDCSQCEKQKTPCDACLWFLPQSTRTQLLRRCQRDPGTHFMDENCVCLLCGIEAPQNQICHSNIWNENGELSTYKDGIIVLEDAIERRYEELKAAGNASPEIAERYERMQAELYGCPSTESNTMPQNQMGLGEIWDEQSEPSRGKNLRQPQIDELLGSNDTRKKIKKATVSKRILPARTLRSAEVETWVLLSASTVEVEPGQTVNVKTQTSVSKWVGSVPHVMKIKKLNNAHWLGPPLDAMFRVKTGVIHEGFFGQICVSVYNKGPNSVTIRQGSVLGSLTRENYLLGPTNEDGSDAE